MKTVTQAYAPRVVSHHFLLSALLVTGFLSMSDAQAVNCSTSYFCYKTMTPQTNTRMPMSHPNQGWVRQTAADQRQNRASSSETTLRTPTSRPANPAPRAQATRNTPPPLRPANAGGTPRPATTSNLQQCLNSRADLMKKAKAVESQAITQAKQKNQENAARLFRTAEKLRKDAQNIRCR